MPDIAAMSTVLKLWKKLRFPSTNKWIKMVWFLYTMEYYCDVRKDEYLSFLATGVELEGIMLNKISQAEKDYYNMDSLICRT